MILVEVYFGAINRFNDGSEGSAVKVIKVNKDGIIRHPKYNPSTIANDIGLLHLSERAPLDNENVGIIDLPYGIDATRSIESEVATLSGFGRTSDQSPFSSEYLNFVQLPIASNKLCANFFGSQYVTDKNVCLDNQDFQGKISFVSKFILL